jgi:uncharacterized protein
MSKYLGFVVLAIAMVNPMGAQSGAQASVQTGAQASNDSTTGINIKKPVFGGACRLCPWGAMAQVVKDAMQFGGYDVQICHNCNAAAAPIIVSEAKVPPPYKVDPGVSLAMAPPNDPGLGPVDFGATAIQFLCAAYQGTGVYANHKPMTNLRLIANVDSRWYLIVAAKADTGITDLSQVKQKHWPVRIFAPANDRMVQAILAYYDLSVESITAAGGHVGQAAEDRNNFDIIIHGGDLSTAPEWNVWYEVSQKFNLNYIELADPLLAKLAQEPQATRGTIPVGLLHGVERTIPTVVRSGTTIYSRSDVPDSFAYDVAKQLDEHQDLLQWTNQNFFYDVHHVWHSCGVPLHAGAARYYREMGYMK